MAWTGSTIMVAVVCGVREVPTVLVGESEVKGRGLTGERKWKT